MQLLASEGSEIRWHIRIYKDTINQEKKIKLNLGNMVITRLQKIATSNELQKGFLHLTRHLVPRHLHWNCFSKWAQYNHIYCESVTCSMYMWSCEYCFETVLKKCEPIPFIFSFNPFWYEPVKTLIHPLSPLRVQPCLVSLLYIIYICSIPCSISPDICQLIFLYDWINMTST